MPPGKSKDDTWKTSELEKSLKDARTDKKRSKDRDLDRDQRKKERDEDHRMRKKKDGDDDPREKRRPTEKSDDRFKDKQRSSKPHEDDEERRRRREERKRREAEEGEVAKEGRDRHRDDRERRPRDADDDRERRHRKENGEDRKHRKPREEDDDRKHRKPREDDDGKRRKHRDEDDGKRRKHQDEDDGKRRKHRDEDDGKVRKHRDEDDGKRRKHRDEDDGKRRKHRDEDDGKHRKHRDEDDGKHRKHRDDDDKKTRRHRDEGEEPQKHKDDDDDEARRKRREEKKAKAKREQEAKQEEEKAKKKKEEKSEAYDEYEDDFEDYEDDFEDDADDDGGENDEDSDASSSSGQPSATRENGDIMDAMKEENARLMSRSNRVQAEEEPETRSRDTRRPATATRTFINFVSAKQRQVSSGAASKLRRRGEQLRQLLELDMSSYDMFDMPPVDEYDTYLRSYGGSNRQQAYVQTNDDNMDREIQTEEVETREKWCQQPPEDIVCCGGADGEDESENLDEKPVDQARLNSFLQRAAQVMTVLLEEDFADSLSQENSHSKQSNIIVSEGFTELSHPAFLQDRHVTHSHFSPVQTHMLLTVSARERGASENLKRQGAICVWNVNEPSRPQKILLCEAQPRCCCFSPTKANLVFAGMEDGSLAAWDLREPAAMHKQHIVDNDTMTLRYPSYNTAGVLHYDNHQSAVVAIAPIVAAGERETASAAQAPDYVATASLGGLSQGDTGEGSAFQLATLEENSVINLWVVAETESGEPAGSESDFGLAPGGKVKLVKSSSLTLESPLREARLRTTMTSLALQLLPANNSHYYVATNTGCVLHGLRYGGKSLPKAYRPDIETPVQVRSVDFSPFPEPVFLAGCEDGTLRLYHIDSDLPLMTWPGTTDGQPISAVRWCRSRPSVFFVLDTRGRLHIWDLQMDDSAPVKQETIAQASVTSLELSNDHSATGLGLPGRRPQMVVALANGVVEVHTMSQQFSALMAEEVDRFKIYLQRAM